VGVFGDETSALPGLDSRVRGNDRGSQSVLTPIARHARESGHPDVALERRKLTQYPNARLLDLLLLLFVHGTSNEL